MRHERTASPTVGGMEAPQGYQLLGHGPAATGPGPGWSMSPELSAQCPECRDLVLLDPTKTISCSCGGLTKDADAGRFGSRRGDAAIAVYRRTA
jgi:hypothetical protein